MFTRVSLVLGAVLAATAVASACELPPLVEELQPKKPAPEAAPFPQVGTVVALDATDGTIKYTVVVGKPVLMVLESYPPQYVFRWQTETVTRKVKMDRLKFFDATGKQVSTEEVWKRLAIGTNFFVSADGKPVPAEHLKLMARDPLVVVDFDNVILDQLVEVLQLANLGRDFENPVLHPGPNPKPILPNPGRPRPEPR